MKVDAPDIRVQAQVFVYKRSSPGSVERIEAGGRLLDAGFTPEDFERLNDESAEEQRAALLGDIIGFITRYVILTKEQAVVVGLWILHAWALAAFDVTAYLAVTSAAMRSGKSLLLEAVGMLVPNAWPVTQPSVAVFFRKISEGVTLLLDECDTIWNARSGEAGEELRGVINSGFQRGMKVPRCSDRGKGIEEFETFGAKLLAGIGCPPPTIADRSFVISMKRKRRTESVQRFRRREVKELAEPIRERLEKWAAANLEALKAARPPLPEALNDRQQDAAEPLLACADLLGADWPKVARAALVTLAREGAEGEGDGEATRLLTDLRRVYRLLEEPERVRTADLVRELIVLEDGPWKRRGWRKEPLEPQELASMLKPYGVRPRAMRFGAESGVRGYVGAELADAFERYVPPTEEARDEAERGELLAPPQHAATPQRAAAGAGKSVAPPPATRPAT